MDIELFNTKGGSLGKRKVPLPPRTGDILMLPQPFPEHERTMSEIDQASWSELQAYVVRHVVWDMVATNIKLVVEETERPPAMR
jgi:hypothetical protein